MEIFISSILLLQTRIRFSFGHVLFLREIVSKTRYFKLVVKADFQRQNRVVVVKWRVFRLTNEDLRTKSRISVAVV